MMRRIKYVIIGEFFEVRRVGSFYNRPGSFACDSLDQRALKVRLQCVPWTPGGRGRKGELDNGNNTVD